VKRSSAMMWACQELEVVKALAEDLSLERAAIAVV